MDYRVNSEHKHKILMEKLKSRLSGPLFSIAFHAVILLLLALYIKPEVLKQADDFSITQQQVDIETLDLEPEPPDLEEIPDPTDKALFEITELNQPIEDENTLDVEETLEIADANEEIPFDTLMNNFTPLKVPMTSNVTAKKVLSKQFGKGRLQKNGLFAVYFNRIDFFGESFMRIDETVNKPLSTESPWPGKVKPVLYSIIWSGRITPKKGGRYTFYLSSDDGARLWIDGKLIINQLNRHATRVDTFTVDMIEGESYDLLYAFCQHYGPSQSRLEWSSEIAGVKRQLIPEDCLWADSNSSLKIMKWLRSRSKNLEIHSKNNPVMMPDQPYSHVINYPHLDTKLLNFIKLSDVVPLWDKYKQRGWARTQKLLEQKRQKHSARKKLFEELDLDL